MLVDEVQFVGKPGQGAVDTLAVLDAHPALAADDDAKVPTFRLPDEFHPLHGDAQGVRNPCGYLPESLQALAG